MTTVGSYINDAEPRLQMLRLRLLSGQGHDGSRAYILLHSEWSSCLVSGLDFRMRVAMSCTDEN